VVLLQSGVQELKEITSRCAEAAPQLVASPYPGRARDVAFWPFSEIAALGRTTLLASPESSERDITRHVQGLDEKIDEQARS